MDQEPMDIDIPESIELIEVLQDPNNKYAGKPKRNLLADFEACHPEHHQIDSKFKEAKRDSESGLQTQIEIATVTMPQSPSLPPQSPEPRKSSASKSEITQPQLQESNADVRPEAMHLPSDSALCMNDLSKSLNELEDSKVLTRSRNIQLCTPAND